MTPYESPDMLRQRVDALTRLVQVSLVLNSTQALDPLLRFIMDSASALVDAEAASILLLDKDTRDLVFAASSSAVLNTAVSGESLDFLIDVLIVFFRVTGTALLVGCPAMAVKSIGTT